MLAEVDATARQRPFARSACYGGGDSAKEDSPVVYDKAVACNANSLHVADCTGKPLDYQSVTVSVRVTVSPPAVNRTPNEPGAARRMFQFT